MGDWQRTAAMGNRAVESQRRELKNELQEMVRDIKVKQGRESIHPLLVMTFDAKRWWETKWSWIHLSTLWRSDHWSIFWLYDTPI